MSIAQAVIVSTSILVLIGLVIYYVRASGILQAIDEARRVASLGPDRYIAEIRGLEFNRENFERLQHELEDLLERERLSATPKRAD